MPWPSGFKQVPDDPWTSAPVEAFALDYDALQHHSWYSNLDETVEEVSSWVASDDILVDYSGGTGILAERLMARRACNILNADASAKFLRLALEKAHRDPRLAFRLLSFRKAEGRMQSLEEVAPELFPGKVRAVVCANAIHLYPDPASPARSWAAALPRGGKLHVQSGNIRVQGSRIIDDTVEAVHEAGLRIVARSPRYAQYRAGIEDPRRLASYDELRRRYFLPARELDAYRSILEAAGFRIDSTRQRQVPVRRDEWTRFLSVYHEGILGWLGGAEKVEGKPPTDAAVQDRLTLLAEAMREAIPEPSFQATWTYISATRG